jgi:hypothetical protein
MKKFIFTILILSQFIFNSIGQDFSLRLFVTDNIGRKDTIEIGLNYSATMDVDVSFGEQDFFGRTWDSLDMRIIQRDSIQHHCLMETNWYSTPLAPMIYFDNNRDLKTDYRPFGSFGTINMNFEILIRVLNPPGFVTTDFSGISGNMYEGWSALHLLDNNCLNIDSKSIYFKDLNDTIYTLNDTLSTLVAEFQHEVSVDESNSNQIKIYPNPTQSIINVKSEYLIVLKLWDTFGRKILETDKKILDLSELPDGIYILGIYNNQDKIMKIQKIIKNSAR